MELKQKRESEGFEQWNQTLQPQEEKDLPTDIKGKHKGVLSEEESNEEGKQLTLSEEEATEKKKNESREASPYKDKKPKGLERNLLEKITKQVTLYKEINEKKKRLEAELRKENGSLMTDYFKKVNKEHSQSNLEITFDPRSPRLFTNKNEFKQMLVNELSEIEDDQTYDEGKQIINKGMENILELMSFFKTLQVYIPEPINLLKKEFDKANVNLNNIHNVTMDMEIRHCVDVNKMKNKDELIYKLEQIVEHTEPNITSKIKWNNRNNNALPWEVSSCETVESIQEQTRSITPESDKHNEPKRAPQSDLEKLWQDRREKEEEKQRELEKREKEQEQIRESYLAVGKTIGNQDQDTEICINKNDNGWKEQKRITTLYEIKEREKEQQEKERICREEKLFNDLGRLVMGKPQISIKEIRNEEQKLPKESKGRRLNEDITLADPTDKTISQNTVRIQENSDKKSNNNINNDISQQTNNIASTSVYVPQGELFYNTRIGYSYQNRKEDTQNGTTQSTNNKGQAQRVEEGNLRTANQQNNTLRSYRTQSRAQEKKGIELAPEWVQRNKKQIICRGFPSDALKIHVQSAIQDLIKTEMGIENAEVKVLKKRIIEPLKNFWQLELKKEIAEKLIENTSPRSFTWDYENFDIYLNGYTSLAICSRCQQHGHMANGCNLKPRCAICSGIHMTFKCRKKVPRCANCAYYQEKHKGQSFARPLPLNHETTSDWCPCTDFMDRSYCLWGHMPSANNINEFYNNIPMGTLDSNNKQKVFYNANYKK